VERTEIGPQVEHLPLARVNDRRVQSRYNAACCAALAGSGKSKDEPPPDEATKAKLRAQALDWLMGEPVARSKLLDTGVPQAREAIKKTLAHCKVDTDLAVIRDEPEFARLPQAERKDWHTLWSDIDGLLKKAGDTSP
jgi:hypothetical protein